MKKGKKLSLVQLAFSTVVLLLVFVSCTKDVETNDIAPDEDPKMYINNDSEQLSERIIYYNDTLRFSNKKATMADDIWIYVAEVYAPNHDGNGLSATHVDIIGNRAYVSYNKQGPEHIGGVVVMNLDNLDVPAVPGILCQVVFDGMDVNAITADNSGSWAERKIWIAGSSFKNGAVLRELTIKYNWLTPNYTDVVLSLNDNDISASANGIVQTEDYLYLSSGQSYGGTYQFLKDDLTLMSEDEYTHAKFPAVNGVNAGAKQVTLATGNNSKLYVNTIGESISSTSFDIETVSHQYVEQPSKGKSIVWMDQGQDIAYVASGMNGLYAYDINSGAQVYHSPTGMLSTGNTNGLCKDDDYIYLANGADGLLIGQLPEDNGEIITVHVWDLDEAHASANLVQTDGQWVFIAKGGGGLKILKRVQN